MAWIGACTLFKSNTPAEVQTLCRHGQVTGRPAAGANHLVAEAFADRAQARTSCAAVAWARVAG
jgi:hypothetical protein